VAFSAIVGAIAIAAVVWAIALPGDEANTGPTGAVPPTGSPSDGSPTGTSGPTGPEPIPPLQLSWSPAYPLASVFGGTGRQAILDAVVTETGVAVAVGHATRSAPSTEEVAAVWRSANGRRWKVIRSDSFGQVGHQRMIAVTEFGDLLVGAGWSLSDAAVWTSSNGGRKWEFRPSDSFGGGGFQYIRDVVVVGSELIAVGSSGNSEERDAAAWRSSDGIAWERMDAPVFVAPGKQEMYAAEVADSRVLGVGFSSELGDFDAAVWAYEDGTWTRVDAASLAAPGNQVMLDVAGGGALPLVAVGCEEFAARCDTGGSRDSDAAVWTSQDGTAWERVTSADDRLAGEGQQAMKAVAVYGSWLVAVGIRASPDGTDIDGALWASSDGTNWEAPGPLSSTATVLGGTGNQSLRALVVYGYRRIELLGFGVTNEGDVEDAQVWRATTPLA
jgi:hypothetical protein